MSAGKFFHAPPPTSCSFSGGGANAGGGSGVDESIPVTEVNVLQHDLPGDLGKLVERRAVPGGL